MTEPSADPARAAGRDALLAFAGVALLVAVLVQIDVTLPAIGHLGSALVAVLFLYVPLYFAWRRKEELDDYGFHAEPVARGLATAGLTAAVIFPLFVLGYLAFYEIACDTPLLAQLAPPGTCNRYGGLDAIHAPPLSWLAPAGNTTLSLEYCLVQVIVVALPEELFFRGFLLRLLEQRFPPKRRLLGGGIGLALLLSSIAFGLIHIPKQGDPSTVATLFPGLVFGWMRSATGSILAPTLMHGASNIVVHTLNLMVLR